MTAEHPFSPEQPLDAMQQDAESRARPPSGRQVGSGWLRRWGRRLLVLVLVVPGLLAISWASVALAVDGPGKAVAWAFALVSATKR